MRALRPLVLCAVAITSLACADATAPDGALRVTAGVLTPDILPGATARVRLTATNSTMHALTVTGPGCPFAMHVYDASGREVGSMSEACTAVILNQRIPAFGYISAELEWSAQVSTPDGVVPAPTGAYTIRGVLTEDRGQHWSAPAPLRIGQGAARGT